MQCKQFVYPSNTFPDQKKLTALRLRLHRKSFIFFDFQFIIVSCFVKDNHNSTIVSNKPIHMKAVLPVQCFSRKVLIFADDINLLVKDTSSTKRKLGVQKV
jgi:hypothetical protein